MKDRHCISCSYKWTHLHFNESSHSCESQNRSCRKILISHVVHRNTWGPYKALFFVCCCWPINCSLRSYCRNVCLRSYVLVLWYFLSGTELYGLYILLIISDQYLIMQCFRLDLNTLPTGEHGTDLPFALLIDPSIELLCTCDLLKWSIDWLCVLYPCELRQIQSRNLVMGH